MSTIIGAETRAKVETQPRGKVIAYWVTTALLAFLWEAEELGAEPSMEDAREGGDIRVSGVLSDHFLNLESAWTIAIVVPGLPRLKEWAYAAIFFGMTSAAASHAFVGDYGAYAYHIFSPLSFAILALA
jgi:hypothetical protein